MRKKYYFFYFLILLFLGIGLSSCSIFSKNGKKSEPDQIYIESFDYEISRNRSTVTNELSYSASFTLDFTLNHEFNVDDLVVKIATVEDAKDNNKSFHFDIDYSNTENVTFSDSKEKNPYILLKYKIADVTTFNVEAQIKITSNDLIDDINKFIKIDCSCESKEMVDKNNILNNGTFKMNYSDDSLIYYEFDEFKEAYTVVSVINRYDSLEIPAIYKGYPVKVIGNGAFFGCSDLKSIILPDSVTSIEQKAFEGCTSLTSMTVPFLGASEEDPDYLSYLFGSDQYGDNSIIVPKSLKEVTIKRGTSIIDYAFENCSSITTIKIPDSITSIGEAAFSGCSSLEDIKLPNSLEKIGKSTFSNCSCLTNVTIPNSVTSIGEAAFYECSNLTNFTIPNSVTNMGNFAFSGCSSLTSITIPNSVTSIGAYAFSGCSSLTSITIPNSMTSISSATFGACSSLTSVTIPSSVTSIGEVAFADCSNLTSITIPNSVTSIGKSAFQDCNSLQYNEYDNGYYLGNEENPYMCFIQAKEVSISSCKINENTKILYEYAFAGCSNLNSIIIPDSITSIESNTFAGCTSLKSITIPEYVTTIKSYAFNQCSGLENIVLPTNNLKSIGSYAFFECSSLTSITIPDSVTTIGYRSFEDCSSLTSITIPDSVTSIGESAFKGCSSLTSITLPFLDSHFGYLFGASSYEYHLIYVPISLKEVIITGGERIGDNAFEDCRYLTSITLSNSVTSIGKYAFSYCDKLTSVMISKNVTSIGYGAFHASTFFSVVYYDGTPDEWNKISIGDQNFYLTLATVYYYSEIEPTEKGNYWHYVDGKPIKW